MFDSHVHGHMSFDSNANYIDIFNKANELSLDGVIITEHLDFFPGKINTLDFDYKSYSNEIDAINNSHRNPDAPIFLKGIELGLVDFSTNELNEFISSNYFDSVIGSVHFVHDEDPYEPAYTADKEKYTAYSRYLKSYIDLLPLYSNINILGHFDYVSRYSENYSDRNMYYKDFSDYFDEIFKYIIEHNISLEINTSTYKKRGSYPINELDINILNRYREMGGELITLGSDAHFPSDLAYRFNDLSHVIKSCGFKYLTHFEERKPIVQVIA